jgi:uncharacterized protein YqgV (UPF0045/DUF77 family)
MNITAELSLYPLTENYIPCIKEYIAQLHNVKGIEVRTHALSTEVFGEFSQVMAAIQAATLAAFEQDPAAVLVAKYLNRDRRGE